MARPFATPFVISVSYLVNGFAGKRVRRMTRLDQDVLFLVIHDNFECVTARLVGLERLGS